MWYKVGQIGGKLLGISIIILAICSSLAAIRLAVCLLRWAITGTFIL